MSQTTYNRLFVAAFPGMLADTASDMRIRSMRNAVGSDVPAGIAVGKASASNGFDFEALTSADELAGLVVNSAAKNPGDASFVLTAGTVVHSGDTANILEEGAIWAYGEVAMAVGDAVYARYTANGPLTVLGALSNASDSGKNRQLKGIRVLQPSTAAGPVLVFVSVSAQKLQ